MFARSFGAPPPGLDCRQQPLKDGIQVSGTQDHEAQQTFAFLLLPDFAMLCFSAAIEPLRVANRFAGRRLYDWQIVTLDGQPASSSGGTGVLADCALPDCERPDYFLVVAGMNAQRFTDPQTIGALRRLDRSGCRVGALSTGSYLLARAGLLNGHRCTVHWENLDGFREDFPDLEVTGELFEADGPRLTSSGGTASLDMMLSLIAKDHGRDLATQVAEQFIHERIRETHDHQRMSLQGRLGVSHPKLLQVIAMMEANLEEPLPRAELARQAGLSNRQLERLFRKYLGRSPTRYYLELRLHRARALLLQTAMSILNVALACGFVSASHFSKCYREFFNKMPRQERQGEEHQTPRADTAAAQDSQGSSIGQRR
ncbi:GlxA family transcriptional regulator [Pelagibius litoralis]|uniref:GlxA family transcriptional regulator n=2 Tax=Pelagibius litoralis TaxID=374515 RepID=A0A967EWU3_9PROT|nr:GlxA family transcriptional regulator [Pelagibius litoralis]